MMRVERRADFQVDCDIAVLNMQEMIAHLDEIDPWKNERATA